MIPFIGCLCPLVCPFSGIAKTANVIAVKALSDDDSDQNSNMWVLELLIVQDKGC